MRLTRPRVDAEVATGFHAAEARALQTALTGLLAAVERAAGEPVPVTLELDEGRDGVPVLVCRNRVVGFVPAEHAGPLRAQRQAAGRRARLVVPGRLVPDGALWRVWVGPVPAGGVPAAPDGIDALPAPQQTVLGVPLRHDDA